MGFPALTCSWVVCVWFFRLFSFARSAFSDGTRKFLKSVERYNVATQTWTQLPDMTIARSDQGFCIHKNKLYIIGGFDGTTVVSDRIYYLCVPANASVRAVCVRARVESYCVLAVARRFSRRTLRHARWPHTVQRVFLAPHTETH